MELITKADAPNMSTSIPVSSPRFGGCRDQGSENVKKCAFSPLDCSSPSAYVKAPEIEGNQCSHPEQVGVGRCSSNVDQKVCTVSSEACQIVSKFQFDPDCNIVEDKTTSLGTHYPSCEYERCVVSKDDCEDGETFYGIGELNWIEPCFCDRVPTGMCYLDSVNPITMDSSYCAVGEYDCKEAYKFMSAAALLDLEQSKPRNCYLCRKADLITSASKHEWIVESGGCFSGDGFLKCALESTECPEVSQFKSSIELRHLGIVPCRADEMTVGKCTSNLDEIDCTSRPSACYLPKKYEPNDSCTVHSNTLTGDPTYYGMCRESQPAGGDRWKQRCVWQESECIDNFEIWWHARLPQSTWLSPCNCEDVETGACEYTEGSDRLYYCAVSSRGCSDPSSYLTSYEMKVLGHTCMLCQPNRAKLDPTPSPTSQGHGAIIFNDGKVPTNPTLTPSIDPPFVPTRTVANQDANKPIIAVYVLVPLLLLALVIFLLSYRGQVYRKDTSNNDHSTSDPTPADDHSIT